MRRKNIITDVSFISKESAIAQSAPHRRDSAERIRQGDAAHRAKLLKSTGTRPSSEGFGIELCRPQIQYRYANAA